VEWAHAIAPGAKILLVVSRSNSLTDLLAAVDFAVAQGASQVSMSWGSNEFPSETSYDFHFNVSGVSFFASSGDNGTGVIWPAASGLVVAVGGTTLYLDSAGNLTQPETAWSGSGGGKSSYEIEPSFQTEWQTTGNRGVPDVSYDADPNTGVSVYDTTSYSGQRGWFTVGGTSAGAPQWAALMALTNAQRSTPLSSANTALYGLGAPATLGNYFSDIVSGCNGNNSCSQVGYDYVTGLGTPLAVPLVQGLLTY
jgi:subtilase family serine protease